MTVVAPASTQGPSPAPPAAHPAPGTQGDHSAFSGILDGLSSSQRKARSGEEIPSETQSPDDDRHAPPPAEPELRTASVDAALSCLFAPAMVSPASLSVVAALDQDPAAGSPGNERAAPETRGSTETPAAAARRGGVDPPGRHPKFRLAGGRKRRDCSEDFRSRPAEGAPGAAPFAAAAAIAAAKQAADAPASFDDQASLSTPEGTAAPGGLDALIDGLPAAVSEAVLALRTPAGGDSEGKASRGSPSSDRAPTSEPPAAKAPSPAARSSAPLAGRAGASAAGADQRAADPPGSTDASRWPTDRGGLASLDPSPSAGFGALSPAQAGFSAPAELSPDTQATPAAEAVPASRPAPAAAGQSTPPVREIDLDLSPGGLEDVTMTMRLSGDRLSVAIRAASAQTASAIEGAREAIAERLAAIGQPLSSLVIQQNGAGNRDAPGDEGGRQGQRQEASDLRGAARRGPSGF